MFVRCQQRGHYYNNCPYKDDPAYDKQRNVKKMSGVPRAFMKRVDNIDNVGDRDDQDGRMFVSGGGTGNTNTYSYIHIFISIPNTT